mmetsp:Transcript_44655/g.136204  ORF Transcript_44655/g.136204 Transcript_44655/m.136204 type:complete len:221 (+) Transcript_44655:135-797(+)
MPPVKAPQLTHEGMVVRNFLLLQSLHPSVEYPPGIGNIAPQQAHAAHIDAKFRRIRAIIPVRLSRPRKNSIKRPYSIVVHAEPTQSKTYQVTVLKRLSLRLDGPIPVLRGEEADLVLHQGAMSPRTCSVFSLHVHVAALQFLERVLEVPEGPVVLPHLQVCSPQVSEELKAFLWRGWDTFRTPRHPLLLKRSQALGVVLRRLAVPPPPGKYVPHRLEDAR